MSKAYENINELQEDLFPKSHKLEEHLITKSEWDLIKSKREVFNKFKELK